MSFWIPRVVMCDVRVLSLKFCPIAEWFELDNLHLVSQHLARLELFGLQLHDGTSCSALEQLEIIFCDLSEVNRISSQTLKSLHHLRETF